MYQYRYSRVIATEDMRKQSWHLILSKLLSSIPSVYGTNAVAASNLNNEFEKTQAELVFNDLHLNTRTAHGQLVKLWPMALKQSTCWHKKKVSI